MSYNIMWAVQWVLVPGILALLLLYGLWLPQNSSNAKAKISGNAGIFAGLIIFVLFIISQQKHTIEFSPDVLVVDLTFWSWVLLIVGFIVGFSIRWLLELVFETRVLGILVLIIVATTTITTYSFFFVKEIRGHVMFAALAILLGAIIYRMFFPDEFVKELKQKKPKGDV